MTQKTKNHRNKVGALKIPIKLTHLLLHLQKKKQREREHEFPKSGIKGEIALKFFQKLED